MKRFHVHVGVENLNQSIAFYSGLFGAEPSVTKPDYAKWMLDDPRVNFAISAGEKVTPGIEHLGIQAESPDELGEIYDRLQSAGRPVFDEGETQCCYAQSTKNWVTDPDGVIWEAFHSHGESTDYGDKIDIAAIARSDNAADGQCCTPQIAQTVHNVPKSDIAASAACCG